MTINKHKLGDYAHCNKGERKS